MAKYKLYQFIRVNKEFKMKGLVGKKVRKKRENTKRTPAKKEEAERLLEEDPSLSLRKAAPNLSISRATTHKLFKIDLRRKFYKISPVQPLEPSHKQQRQDFCEWILGQEEDLVERVIWTDEKIFVLHQKPNRKNDGRWAAKKPHEIIE